MSTHEPSSALVSTDKNGAKALWVVMVPLHQAHECSLAVMSAVGAMAPRSWVFMASYECSWLLINAYEQSWARMSAAPYSHMSTNERSWVLLSIHKHSWALISSHEHSWAWHHRPTSMHDCGAIGPLALIKPWWHSHQCIGVLRSAHGGSWVFLSIP